MHALAQDVEKPVICINKNKPNIEHKCIFFFLMLNLERTICKPNKIYDTCAPRNAQHMY